MGGKSVDLVTMEANPTFQPCLLCNYGLGLVPLVPPGQIRCGPLTSLHPKRLEEATGESLLGEAGAAWTGVTQLGLGGALA